MHIYGKDQQAFHLSRTRVEKYFSRLNAIIVAMQLACWLCSIIRVAINAGNSMTNTLFTTSNLQLNAVYTVPGCVYRVTRTHAFFNNVTFDMSPETVEYYVSRSVVNLRHLWALTGVYTVVSIVNRLFFETNTYELRYHFAIFRKDTLTTWELLLLVLGIVMTFGVTKENELLQDYIVYCSAQESLPKQYYNSVLPFVELYVMYFISLGFFIINLLVATWNLSKENPRDKMLREDERKRAALQEVMQRYWQPGTGYDTSNSNTPHDASRPPPPPQHQRVTYGGNLASVGGDGLEPYPGSPPPALRRQPGVEPRPAPVAEATAASPLYANRLPSRGKSNASQPLATTGSPSTRPLVPGSQGSQGNQNKASADRSSRPVTPPVVHAQGSPHQGDVAPGGSSSGGRYELREVYDDDDDGFVDDVPLDPTDPDSPNFSLDGPAGGVGDAYGRQGTNYSGGSNVVAERPPMLGKMPPPPQGPVGAASVISTPLLATRNAVIPPPPPVGMGNSSEGGNSNRGGGGGHRPSISKMLAPPSPPNNGGDTTADTVRALP